VTLNIKLYMIHSHEMQGNQHCLVQVGW